MTERAPEGMRRFVMNRSNDASGVSGTGLVLEGVQFSTGVVVIHWLTPPPRGSISVFDHLDQFLQIHVEPHPDNRTEIVFEDGIRLRCGEAGVVYLMPDDQAAAQPAGRLR
ncbi:MAG: hypothetical protein ACR2H3_08800 [Acidimicrobiales bacterium]